MTASLPVPHDDYPDAPDGLAESAREKPARIVRLPRLSHRPRKPAVSAAQAAMDAEAAAARQSRPPGREAIPHTPVDPGPPPPLPADLRGDALVIPPKPPLPALADERTGERPASEDAVDPDASAARAAEPTTFVSDRTADEVRPDPASAVDVPAEIEPAEVEPVEDEPAEVAMVEPVEGEPVAVAMVQPVAGALAEQVVTESVAAELVEPSLDEPVSPVVEPVEAVLVEPVEPVELVEPVEPAPSELEPVLAEAVDLILPETDALAALAVPGSAALSLRGVQKYFGDTRAVDGIDLTVPAGTFYGLVGPNGAGKTTTLSMIAGLLRPDRGSIVVGGVDAKAHPVQAKRLMGVLPDRLRTFDRLTGRQLLYYYGVLRGLKPAVVESRTADLARAFDLTDALSRVVSDYSAGMTKKVMLAGAMIHSPRVLVLDEPFESVDPVSSAIILDILSAYVAHGGTVILSSHGMDLVERVCSRVAVLVAGQVLAEGTVDDVRGELTLEQRFIELAGGLSDVEGLEWLHTFSD